MLPTHRPPTHWHAMGVRGIRPKVETVIHLFMRAHTSRSARPGAARGGPD
jgi:hypothetical protein